MILISFDEEYRDIIEKEVLPALNKKKQQIINDFNKVKERIIYVKHSKNKNGAAARNTGFAIAKGKYISLLDSDDEYFEERLEKCYNRMEICSDKIAGVYTGCEFRRNKIKYHIHNKVQRGNFLIGSLACTFMLSSGSNIFIRKKIVDELFGFDEGFLRHQDYEFLVRVFGKYDLEAIKEVLIIKNNENFNLPDVYKMINIKKMYLDKFSPIIEGLDEKKQKYIYHSHYISIAEQALRTKEYIISSEYYLKAKQYGRMSFKNKYRKLIFTILNYIK